MSSFEYEEQGGKTYLIYKISSEERIDTLTLEMLSNNRIEGTVPVIFIIGIRDSLTRHLK